MLDWFDRHFSVRLPPGRFARNTALLSLAGLLPVLAVFITRTPGFWGHLAGAQGALGPFLRQVLTNGLPVVVAVNWVGLVLFARLRAGGLRPGVALGLDFAARIGLFAGLHAVIFAGSALAFGAFGGDPAQALGVLGPTLLRAAGFGNLAGVWLHATLVSALPLYMALAAAVLAQRGYRDVPLAWLALPAAGIIACQLLLLTGVAWALSRMI